MHRNSIIVAIVLFGGVSWLSACIGSSTTPGKTDVTEIRITFSDIVNGRDVRSKDLLNDELFQSEDLIGDNDSDTGPAEGRLGWPCKDNIDCQSGICIESEDGKVCTESCINSCPAGWSCRAITWAGDDIFICLPRFLTLCAPCNKPQDCNPVMSAGGAGCIDNGPDGSFCGGDCSVGDCPRGYTCKAVSLPQGVEKQCVPESGQCKCSKRAITMLASTTCYIKNAAGKCIGTRKCDTMGLTVCTAATPRPEECNKLDDNCNGLTDDGLSAVPCSNTNEYGTCKGTGKCVDGQVTECNARVPAAEKCDKIDDNCNGQTDEGACCTPKTCDDLGKACGRGYSDNCGGVLDCGGCKAHEACQDGACVAQAWCGNGKCEVTDNETCGTCPADCGCGQGDVCYQNACCTPKTCADIGGKACGQGYSDNCGGVLDCGECKAHEACQDGKCVAQAWCGNGKCEAAYNETCVTCPADCGAGDGCVPGQTKGLSCGECKTQDWQCGKQCKWESFGSCGPVVNGTLCTDDENFCTSDVCSNGQCTHPKANEAQSCGGSNKFCHEGSCLTGCGISGVYYTSGAINPGNQCQYCDPTSPGGGSVWTNKTNNTSCDDGNKCNGISTCQSGNCQQTTPAITCSAPPECHTATGATCNADTGSCVYPSLSNGTSCDDGNKCNGISTCQSGSCKQATPPVTCNVPPVCHTATGATCNADTGTCSYPALLDGTSCDDSKVCDSGSCKTECYINGHFYSDGTNKPLNKCQKCDVSRSTTDWTNKPDGTSCGGGQVCKSGKCGSGCYIDGAFYPDGTTNPLNKCQQCSTSNSTTGWTSKVNGTSCDDGNKCNGVLTCQSGSCKQTTSPVTCNNPPACHTATGATCNADTGACVYPALSNGTSCGRGKVCDSGTCKSGCYIDGNFYANGTTNPFNSCQACDVSISPTIWSSAHEAQNCESSAKFCHNGNCMQGCGINGVFYPSGTPNPSNQCQYCNPYDSSHGGIKWSDKTNNTSCDDGNKCNGILTCQSGRCKQTTSPVTCNSPQTCHTLSGATCNRSTGTCTYPNRSNGTSCDDGNKCNGISTCQSGSCTQTTSPVTCNSPQTCHTATGATCNTSTGTCSYPNRSNGTSCGTGEVCVSGSCNPGCYISGHYYSYGAVNPSNSCQACNALASTTSWSPASEAQSCGTGKFCHAGSCLTGCGISGVYYTNGTVNPGNKCQYCDSSNGSAWTGKSCTGPQTCHTLSGATCNTSTGTCTYPNQSNGTSCDDGNKCNGISTCQSGSCTQTTSPVTCNSPQTCHTATGATCNTSTGTCSYPSLANNTSCDDGNKCNGISTCQSGSCAQTTSPVTCNSPQTCHTATDATCNTSTGACSYPNLTNNQQATGCNGTCQACQNGTCSYASSGTDPGGHCSVKTNYRTGGNSSYCQEQVTSGNCNSGGSCGGYGSWTGINNGNQCNTGKHCSGTTVYTGYSCSSGSCNGNYGSTSGCCDSHQCASGQYCRESDFTCRTTPVCKKANDGFGYTNVANGTSCGSGHICDSGSCVAKCYIGGVLYASGATNGPCQSCQPSKSTTGWSSANEAQSCSSPTKFCHAGSCLTGCGINSVYYAADAINPGNQCQYCYPPNGTAWTGKSCDNPPTCHTTSGATCNTSNGACSYPNQSNGTSCGSGLVCDAGSCVAKCYISNTFYTNGVANPSNSCQKCDTSKSTTSWSPANEAQSCSAPTKFCHAGSCLLGCGISGVYYTSGTVNPGNKCQYCDPSGSQGGFAWTDKSCNSPGECQTASGATCNTSTGDCNYPTVDNNTYCGPAVICCAGSCVSNHSNYNCGTCNQQCPPPKQCLPCFVAGTMVRMADGSERPIESIKTGDKVMGFNVKTPGLAPAVVTKTFVHPAKATPYTLIINKSVRATPNHPFFANHKWVRAAQLKLGDRIIVLTPVGFKSDTIKSIQRAKGMITTYNLEVDSLHDYFAGGILVHNKFPSCIYLQ